MPDRPPFATATGDSHEGIAVDLWRMAAEELGVVYDYVDVPRGGAAEALRSGAADLVLAVDARAELEARADLTQPLYTATLGVVSDRSSRILTTLQGFASWRFLQIVAGLSALLLVVGAVVWAIERRGNDEQFHRDPLRGLGDGFWWAGVTLTTIGYGDKAPVTLLGRAVAMLWMLIGLAVSAALTAAVVTLAGAEREPTDALEDGLVAAVEGTTAQAYLEGFGADLRAYPSAAEALDALERGDVRAVAASAPSLRHAVEEAGSSRRVGTTRLDPHYVAIALPEGSELREPLDRVLLALLTSEAGQGVIERHLPQD